MFRTALTSILILCAASVSADEGGLYPEAAPEDAAFVRFVGMGDAGSADFAGHRFAWDDDANAAYIPVSAALLDGVDPGSFLTVIPDADGLSAIAETPRPDRSKVYLFLVNTTAQPLSLRVIDGNIPVIADIAPMAAGSRAVNPVQIALGVFDGDTAVAEFDVTMKRGQNLSFVARAGGVELIPHRFGPVSK